MTVFKKEFFQLGLEITHANFFNNVQTGVFIRKTSQFLERPRPLNNSVYVFGLISSEKTVVSEKNQYITVV